MPLYDYECSSCGHIHERMGHWDDQLSKLCPCCELRLAKRIVSCGNGVYLGNQDATWLKSVREVVGNETREGQAFLRDPTRANYRAWMHRKGLRPLEPGEKGGRSEPPVDQQAMIDKLARRHRERTALKIKQ